MHDYHASEGSQDWSKATDSRSVPEVVPGFKSSPSHLTIGLNRHRATSVLDVVRDSSDDLYNFKERLWRKVAQIEGNEDISQHNKTKILEFKRFCFVNGIGTARTLRYLYDLPKLATLLSRNFEDAEREDIEAVIHDMESSEYSPRTKLDFKA